MSATELAGLVATLGPLGEAVPGPGFVAGLLGIGWFLLISKWLPRGRWIGAAAQAAGATAVADTAMAAGGLLPDAPSIVIDEFVGAPLALLGFSTEHSPDDGEAASHQAPDALSATRDPSLWADAALRVALFAVLDTTKPLGLGAVEALPGGVGVVADDLAAGLVAALAVRSYRGLIS